jgi:UDPglucose 6-dehydrogenase
LIDKICVIGLWHLGCVYAACLADLGYNVIGVDSDRKRVNNLARGTPPLYEPGLAELIAVNIKAGRLDFTLDLHRAAKGARYVLVTIDTPLEDNDEVDLSSVLSTAEELGECLEDKSIVVISSQVPVGTCHRIKALIKEKKPSLAFDIAYSPENLRLGKATDYFKNQERIVIGADSEATLDAVEKLFGVIPAPKLRMNLKSAEMSKHAINAFLATTISFANELANLCDEAGADALSVAAALKSESRIGPGLPLLPGLGFAGGTLARDLNILRKLGDGHNYDTRLIDAVLAVNREQNRLVIRKLEKIFGSLEGLTVGILGLTYKVGTSTLRRSAALEIIRDLHRGGATVKAGDPKANLTELKHHREFEFCSEPDEVARDADALVLVTEWPEFRDLDFDHLKSLMRRPVIIDTKNMLYDQQLGKKGFIYSGVGTGLAEKSLAKKGNR